MIAVAGRVIVGAAVAAVVCIGVSACTSSTTSGSPPARTQSSAPTTSTMPSTPTPTAPVTSADQAKALIASATHVDAENFQTGSFSPTVPATRMEHVVQFTTPSGNIRCTFASELPSLLMCSIDSYDFAPPSRPASCTLNWATGLINLTPQGATIGQCVGGPQVTYNSKALSYGRAIEALGLGCYSAESGLTCVQLASGHGFTVSRAAFTAF